VRRRIDIEPDDVAQFADKARVVGQLELAHPMRLQTIGAPDGLNRTHAEPRRFRRQGAGPMGRPPDGSPSVSAATRYASVPGGLMREGRVLSRYSSSPSNPSSIKRSCQRQTQVLDLPVRRISHSCRRHRPSTVGYAPARLACAARWGLEPGPLSRRISADETESDFPARIAQIRTSRPRWAWTSASGAADAILAQRGVSTPSASLPATSGGDPSSKLSCYLKSYRQILIVSRYHVINALWHNLCGLGPVRSLQGRP
jgi:hypothetical protein